MHRLVSDVIPALRDEPGFVGVLSLVGPDSGDAILSCSGVLWPSRRGERAIMRPRSVWEVKVRV